MSVILETLQIASFKGVSFLFTSHSEQGGRKSVTFEYPDQNTRFVQDLGKMPRTFTIVGTIADQTFNYYTQRNNLIDVLTSADSGVLVHPYEGTITVFCKGYTLTEDIDKMGVATFRMTFEETGDALYPTTSKSFSSNVEAKIDNAILSLDEDFSKGWQVTDGYLNNFNYSKNLIESLLDNFLNLPSLVLTLSSDAYDSFTSILTDYVTNINFNVLNSSDLASSTSSLFESGSALSDEPSEQSSLMESFFGYVVDASIDQTTVILEERERNRQLLTQYINYQALVRDYVFVTQTTFFTDMEIQTKSDLLTSQFELLVLNNVYENIIGNTTQVLSNTTLSALEDIRSETHAYLRSQETNVKTTVSVNVPRNSLLKLTYQYYGKLDLKQTLYDLNQLTSATNLTGSFLIISGSDLEVNNVN